MRASRQIGCGRRRGARGSPSTTRRPQSRRRRCVPRLLEEVEDRGGGGGFVEDGANEIGALGRRVLQCVREEETTTPALPIPHGAVARATGLRPRASSAARARSFATYQGPHRQRRSSPVGSVWRAAVVRAVGAASRVLAAAGGAGRPVGVSPSPRLVRTRRLVQGGGDGELRLRLGLGRRWWWSCCCGDKLWRFRVRMAIVGSGDGRRLRLCRLGGGGRLLLRRVSRRLRCRRRRLNRRLCRRLRLRLGQRVRYLPISRRDWRRRRERR